MKIISIRYFTGTLALMIFIGICHAFAQDPDNVRYARLTSVSGDVLIIPETSSEIQTARMNYPFLEGDRLMTGEDGAVEIQIDDGSICWLWHRSKLDMTSLGYVEGSSTQIFGLKLWTGTMYCRFRRPADLGSRRFIDIGGFHVMPGEQCLLKVSITMDGVFEIGVLDGSAIVMYEDDKRRLQAQSAVEWNEGWRVKALSIEGVFDEWVIERDKLLGGYYGNTDYIPEDFREDVSDLNQHGKWVYNIYLSSWCWAPYVSPGWVPYRYGTWVWEPCWGWTWVPDEPWGWIPYHYGYWAFYFDMGWVWVPHWRWGPHWVAWRYTGRSVYWVPLHPLDRLDASGRLIQGSRPKNSRLKIGIPIESSLSFSDMIGKQTHNMNFDSVLRHTEGKWLGNLPKSLTLSKAKHTWNHESDFRVQGGSFRNTVRPSERYIQREKVYPRNKYLPPVEKSPVIPHSIKPKTVPNNVPEYKNNVKRSQKNGVVDSSAFKSLMPQDKNGSSKGNLLMQ